MRAAIYIRVSTSKQEDEGTSLQTQLDKCLEAATKQGYTVEQIHIYREVESGSFIERKELTRMMDDAERGEFEKAYALTADRVSRNGLDLLNIIKRFTDCGVILDIIEGSSDNSPEGQLVMFIQGWAAERERLMFRERSRLGREKAAREGRMPSGSGLGLFGYDPDPEKRGRIINEREAAFVREMFQKTLEGWTRYGIANWLNELGIKTKTGKKWTANAVDRILRTHTFKGVMYYGQKPSRRVKGKVVRLPKRPLSETILIENFCPPIISSEMFNAVQEKLDSPQARQKKDGPKRLLTGMVRCRNCGRSVVGSMYAAGNTYYRCTGAIKAAGREITCLARHIRGDWLEPLVWDMVCRVIKDPGIISRELRRHAETSEGDLAGEMKRLGREIDALKQEQGQLMKLFAAEGVDQEILMGQIAPLKALCDKNENTLSRLQEQQSRRADAAAVEERISGYCRQFSENLDRLTQEGKRAVLSAFGVKVEATLEELLVTVEVNPDAVATTTLPSSNWQDK